jgi:nitronate monooxygenase
MSNPLLELAQSSGIKPLFLKGKQLVPIVQGGMGVGVSAGGLAGAVARLGGIGTVSSVDLRRLHPDLMERTANAAHEPGGRELLDKVNLIALEREIKKAKAISQGNGFIAVNIMKALSAYEAYARCALDAGADALVVGAGLPLDLPDIARDYPHVALIPILSDARGVQLVLRKWEKKGRLPDAIVIEHPRLAGGHLGAAKVADLNDPRFEFEQVIPAVLEFLEESGFSKSIPLIAAGGISSREDIQRLQTLGASGVQLGTAFAVTIESDAAPAFKEVLANAEPKDIVEFVSVAGLPARAVRTPWLEKYLRIEDKLKSAAHLKKKGCNLALDCLAHCGLRDGVASMGQFCIDRQLGHALTGDTDRGLYFRGAGRLPFGKQIRSVEELMRLLLGDLKADQACA